MLWCLCLCAFVFVLNLRSCSDLWLGSVCGVRVCGLCGVHVCVSWYRAIFAFELAAHPSHPLRYEQFLSPFSRSCDIPPRGAAHCRIVCLLWCLCLCAFVFVLNGMSMPTPPPEDVCFSTLLPGATPWLAPRHDIVSGNSLFDLIGGLEKPWQPTPLHNVCHSYELPPPPLAF